MDLRGALRVPGWPDVSAVPPRARAIRMGRLVPLVATLVSVACSDEPNLPVALDDSHADQVASELDLALVALLDAQGGVDYFRLPGSGDLARIPQDPLNPLTAAKVALGRLLFHETALGLDARHEVGLETYSCASCHFAQAGFQANLPQGVADGGSGFGVAGEGRVFRTDVYGPGQLDVQPIRTPSTMNTAYQELMLWNGQFGGVGDNLEHRDRWFPGSPQEANRFGFQGLETQAIAGLRVHRLGSVPISVVAKDPEYRALFQRAFPGDGEVTTQRAGLAIAAFERTLLANLAPWQRWLAGLYDAMSPQQKEGALLFFGRAGCSGCHTGPALNSMTFHALGMPDLKDAVDTTRVEFAPSAGHVPHAVERGRGGFTDDPADYYKFKTPQLYNLTDSRFYGHGASFTRVRDVIAYKNRGRPAKAVPNLDPAFVPLGLGDEEIDALTAFVEDALHDPALMRYVPERLPSGNCTPVNDAAARADLGCS